MDIAPDEALGAALLDAAQGKRLRAEIAEVSSMNRGGVDRFFAQHPEFAATLEDLIEEAVRPSEVVGLNPRAQLGH